MDILQKLGYSLLVYFITRIAVTYGQGKSSTQEQIGHIYSTIFHKYDIRVRPSPFTDPVSVDVDFNLIRLDINSNDNLINVVGDFTVSWKDRRLTWYAEESTTAVTLVLENVWTPDVHFLDALSPVAEVMSPRYFVVRSDGIVVLYKRVSVKLACDLNSTAAEQECSVRFGSMQFPEKELKFQNVFCSMNNFVDSRNWMVSFSDNVTISMPHSHIAHPGTNRSEALCEFKLTQAVTPAPTTPMTESLVAEQAPTPMNGVERIHVSLILMALILLLC